VNSEHPSRNETADANDLGANSIAAAGPADSEQGTRLDQATGEHDRRSPDYFVQLGLFGHVGRLAAAAGRFGRGERVVCRTERGLELGRILSIDDRPDESEGAAIDGTILRRMAETDHLLQARIETRRDAALAACEREIERRGLDVRLIDVEHLFDGASLYFYFLGTPDERLEALTRELAETYETKVRFRQFAERLATGCGPGCGTEAKGGACGTGGCSTCGSGGCSVRSLKSAAATS